MKIVVTGVHAMCMDGAGVDGVSVDGAGVDVVSVDGAGVDGESLDGAGMDGAEVFYRVLPQKLKWVLPRVNDCGGLSSQSIASHIKTVIAQPIAQIYT